MIAKQVKGRGFRGCLNYLLGKDGAELIGGNMLGENARELAAEFSASRKLRPNLQRAVYHASLSLAPGEKLTDAQWGKVAEGYVKQMGFEGSQYCVVRHRDREHEHVHIVASRIRMDGTYVSESQDYKRSETILRGIEREHGLRQVKSSREVEHRAPSRHELELAQRGIPSAKLSLQALIDRHIQDRPTMTEFLSRMEGVGVSVLPNVAKTGHVSGVTYLLDGEPMKGSDLGRGYTWSGLQKRGVNYEPNRDRQAISRAKELGGSEWIRARPIQGGQEGVSERTPRRDHPADRASFERAQHHQQGQSRDDVGNEGPHQHLSKEHLQSARVSAEGSQRNRVQGTKAHPGALGEDAPSEHRHRSRERELILRLAVVARERQASRRKLEGSRSPLSTTPARAAEEGQPHSIWKPHEVVRFNQELAETEEAMRQERLNQKQLELEKKLKRERELEQRRKLERNRGRGREGPDFGL